MSAPSEASDPIYIGNAGLALLNPYLPALFERLQLLSDVDGEPRVVGLEAASRGVHLLQYIAEGRLDRPEATLTFNKLLCGLAPAAPVLPSITPSRADLDVCDSLILAIIGNWPSLAGASPEVLRETFLQREGGLRGREESWALDVQRKAVDVLVDQVPWSLATIRCRWMTESIGINWSARQGG